MSLADRDYMKGVGASPSNDDARPALWLRLQFALWRVWRRLRQVRRDRDGVVPPARPGGR